MCIRDIHKLYLFGSIIAFGNHCVSFSTTMFTYGTWRVEDATSAASATIAMGYACLVLLLLL